MQVILTQDVNNLGKAGEVVTVKNGFGRNYLIPQGLAITANSRNVRRLDHERKIVEARVKKEVGSASDVAGRINGMTLQFERLVGEGDKLFGSVTAADIATQLEVAGIKVDHRKIKLGEPIRALGKYETEIKLHPSVAATLKFWVV
ncbi:MAG TPA: 50S ribosomal protein L9, partial [Kofleriaceae bacterium]|nr:50S ribosomal protein L9 [Kofleriaceae bacterium]